VFIVKCVLLPEVSRPSLPPLLTVSMDRGVEKFISRNFSDIIVKPMESRAATRGVCPETPAD
jgi:hypothetical protein